jgi:carnitine 3-dehydrogenase
MIQRVAIIGTGVIGSGWIARLLQHGITVAAYDPAPGYREQLNAKVQLATESLKRTGVCEHFEMSNLTLCDSLAEACRDADWIQENGPENIEIKHSIHREIEAAARSTAIIASSSSGLLPTDIQSVYQQPERLIIGHPFNPVYLLPLVEIVGGNGTSEVTIDQAKAFYRHIGMKPLHVRKEIEGYLSDRLQEALWREILHLVNDDVATTDELDDAIIYGPGLRWAIMGTCLTFHLAGGDNGMRHMLEQFGPALKLPWTKLEAPELTDELIDKMVAGTQAQAGEQSVAELEKLRDDCLVETMRALKKYQVGAGKLIN